MNEPIIFENVRDFDPDKTFDCGQCFRWEGCRGAVVRREVSLEYDAEKELLRINDPDGGIDAGEFWRKYFDLDRDYAEINRQLIGKGDLYDPVMERAIDAGKGIRILNQDRWETLISFIISQNNNIPRIKKCIEGLSSLFGGFPTPLQLADATEETLAPVRLGYRAKYLVETAKTVVDEGYDEKTGDCRLLDNLAKFEISRDEAVSELTKLSGVGPKVAGCIALFCLGKIDSFPLDVWMKRVMNRLYGINEKDTKAMKEYADEHFGEYGGIAQQYLFYYITHMGKVSGKDSV